MIVLFTGPSLPPSQVPELRDLQVCPPAAQGDVYRAAKRRPWGIGIIDGYFERLPAVWHKEILWALSEGIHVFGAASMGALRAAELSAFGMVGVGAIFDSFEAGLLSADDEVAVAHASAEDGYRVASEALVNIRATLEVGVADGICGNALALQLFEAARELFYADRAWPTVLAQVERAGADAGAVDAFARWLPRGCVNQKRLDALELVELMQATRRAHPGRFEADFVFEHSDAWESAKRRVDAELQGEQCSSFAPSVLNELRLEGNAAASATAQQGALLRALAEELSKHQGLRVDAELLQATMRAFLAEQGMTTEAPLRRWLEAEGLDSAAFGEMMAREARLRWLQARSRADVPQHLADQLRAMGCYRRLSERARDKREQLERNGVDAPGLEGAGLRDEASLWRWYFEERLGESVPNDLPLRARQLGFSGLGDLFRAVLLERWYLLLRDSSDSPRRA